MNDCVAKAIPLLPGARRKPRAMPAAARFQQILQVVEQSRRRMHPPHARLDFREGLALHDWLDFAEQLAPIQSEEHGSLGGAVGDAEFDAHEETVELRFGQRKRADLMLRILRRHDEKRRGQRVRHAIDRHVRLLHRFEQRALRLRRRAIDFIDQHDLRKQWTGMENKSLLFAVEDRIAHNVRRQQVAGELNPPEVQPQPDPCVHRVLWVLPVTD